MLRPVPLVKPIPGLQENVGAGTPGEDFEDPSNEDPGFEHWEMAYATIRTRAPTTSTTDEMQRDLCARGMLGGWLFEAAKFELGVELGSGSAGQVFKAVHAPSQSHVAIKVIHEDLGETSREDNRTVEDMLQEIKVFASLGPHPHLVGFFGMFLSPAEEPCIAMELMTGGSVADVLRVKARSKGGAWRAPKAISFSWCAQLCAGLDFLHDRKTPLVHRDIKPSNLFVSGDLATLKLGDFGLCRPVRAKKAPESLYSSASSASSKSSKRRPEAFTAAKSNGSKVPAAPCNATPGHEEVASGEAESDEDRCMTGLTGTYAYMAPEVTVAATFFPNYQYSYDEKADIFSAAICMRALVTGEMAYEPQRRAGERVDQIARQVAWDGLRQPLDTITYTPMAKLISQMWEHEAAARPGAGLCQAQIEMMISDVAAKSSKPLAVLKRHLPFSGWNSPLPGNSPLEAAAMAAATSDTASFKRASFDRTGPQNPGGLDTGLAFASVWDDSEDSPTLWRAQSPAGSTCVYVNRRFSSSAPDLFATHLQFPESEGGGERGEAMRFVEQGLAAEEKGLQDPSSAMAPREMAPKGSTSVLRNSLRGKWLQVRAGAFR